MEGPVPQQEVESTFNSKPDGTIFTIPNMGTKNTNENVAPTVPCASNLDELHNECKQYKFLRKQDEMDSKQEVGTAAYLVSTAWLKRYEKFLMFDQFE